MPLRSSFESCACASFLKTERECDERWAMDWALEPGCVSSVSVDSMNSCRMSVLVFRHYATVNLPEACPVACG